MTYRKKQMDLDPRIELGVKRLMRREAAPRHFSIALIQYQEEERAWKEHNWYKRNLVMGIQQ